MTTEHKPHSILTATQAQRGLRAAAEQMRKVGLPKSADLIEECVQSLEEQLETSERELAWFRKTRVAERAERDSLVEQLEAAHRALGWYAERRNYAPAGGESAYDAVTARDGYDGRGPGSRARAVLYPAMRPS